MNTTQEALSRFEQAKSDLSRAKTKGFSGDVIAGRRFVALEAWARTKTDEIRPDLTRAILAEEPEIPDRDLRLTLAACETDFTRRIGID